MDIEARLELDEDGVSWSDEICPITLVVTANNNPSHINISAD